MTCYAARYQGLLDWLGSTFDLNVDYYIFCKPDVAPYPFVNVEKVIDYTNRAPPDLENEPASLRKKS